MKWLTALVLASTAMTGAAAAQTLRDSALEIFKPLPSTVPAVKDNPAHPNLEQHFEKVWLDR